MSGTTVTSSLTISLTLGSPGYIGPIYIERSGKVAPDAYGANAIYVLYNAETPILTNRGVVVGGVGSSGSLANGGTGVILQSGTLFNAGSVTGGIGGELGGSVVASSGEGVQLGLGGTLINYGVIGGGVGRDAVNSSPTITEYGGDGATGVSGKHSTIFNHSLIDGGGGGSGEYHGAGNGGAGIELTGGLLYNSGSITAGNGGFVSDFRSNGAGGGVGLKLDGTTFTNFHQGVIRGGNGGIGVDYSNFGGVAVEQAGGRGLNEGLIVGGKGGGNYSYGFGGDGGIGVELSDNAFFLNQDYTNATSDIFYAATIAGGGDGENTEVPASAGRSNGGFGVSLNAGATLQNAALIEGGTGGTSSDQVGAGITGAAGVYDAGGVVFNSGIIIGGTGGTNYGGASSGNVGGQGGVGISSTGLVINSGTIEGGLGGYGFVGSKSQRGAQGDAVDGGTLVVEPKAVFVGSVEVATLALAGSTHSQLSGLGEQFNVANTIIFDAGSSWTVEGNLDGLGSGQAIDGFTLGETIVLDGVTAYSKTFGIGGLELDIGGSEATLAIAGPFKTTDFVISNRSNEAVITIACFVAGTHISTPYGETTVESLKIGDLVMTLYNGPQPIKWIGRRAYSGRSLQRNKTAIPICIKPDAIEDGVPIRSLWVSPGHAISVNKVLVHASRLQNGVSILQPDNITSVNYYHIELENHEIIFAENCAVESFMDESFRKEFNNADEFKRLYPGHLAPQVMCQPRLDSGFELFEIQQTIKERAGIRRLNIVGGLRGYVDGVGNKICFGWAQDLAAPEEPVCLDIFQSGRRIGQALANLYREDVRAAGFGSGYQGFEYPVSENATGGVEVRRSADGALLPPAG